MDEEVTIDLIIGKLTEWVQSKTPISPHVWVDAALKMATLLGEETDKLYDLQQKVALTKVTIIDQGGTVAKAKAIVEASNDYKEAMRQKAKIDRVIEMIRVAKLRARLEGDEYKAQ